MSTERQATKSPEFWPSPGQSSGSGRSSRQSGATGPSLKRAHAVEEPMVASTSAAPRTQEPATEARFTEVPPAAVPAVSAAVVQQASSYVGQELPEGFPGIWELPASLKPSMRTWAYAWREIRGDVPASGELALRLQAYVHACVERNNARRDFAEANVRLDRANDRMDQFATGPLSKESENSALVLRAMTQCDNAQAASDKAQAALAAAEARVAAADEAVNALIVPAPVEAADAPLLEPHHLIVPRGSAHPHLHEENTEFPLPGNHELMESAQSTAQRLQNTALSKIRLLETMTFRRAEPQMVYRESWQIGAEEHVAHIFEREILTRAKAIVEHIWLIGMGQRSKKLTLITGYRGSSTDHVDYFIQVAVSLKRGDRRSSMIGVEFKTPPGRDAQHPPLVFDDPADGDDYIASRAEMPDKEFFLRTFEQLHEYVRNSAKRSPFLEHTLNQEWGILTNFNELWFAKFQKSARNYNSQKRDLERAERELESAEDAAEAAEGADTAEVTKAAEAVKNAKQVVESARIARDCADSVSVSTRFRADNASPHISFAVAYVIDQVVQDIVNNPSKYVAMDQGVGYDSFNAPPAPPGRRTRPNPKRARGGRSGPSGAGRAEPKPRIKRGGQRRLAEGSSKRAQPESVLSSWNWLAGSVVIGKFLGCGRTGIVHAGALNGEQVALKISRADADEETLLEFDNEKNIYQHLKTLQGDVIARLLEYGLLKVNGATCAVLVLEHIEDIFDITCAKRTTAERLPQSTRRGALEALDKIHMHGVVHGDPNMANLIFERTGAPDHVYGRMPGFSPLSFPLKARFVDFAYADVNPTKQAINNDRFGWMQALELPEGKWGFF